MGACLRQWQDDSYKIIGYASTSFSETQRRYSTIERELSAVRFGLNVFKPFLLGITFIIYTDHKPLIHMYNMAYNSNIIFKTLEEISEFDFELKYIPGEENLAADLLSRLKSETKEEEHL